MSDIYSLQFTHTLKKLTLAGERVTDVGQGRVTVAEIGWM